MSSERAQALGASLKRARTERSLTQDALALKTGITSQHIQRIERGKANPTLATVYALADVLQLELNELLPS